MNRIILLITCLLCLATFTACQQEDVPTNENGETVSLTLNIGMQDSQTSGTRATAPNVQPYEGIRTLRVIIISGSTDTADRTILHNEKITIDSSSDPTEAILATEQTINNIPVGQASIYLIANEESIDMEYTDEVLTGETYKDDKKLLLLDEGWKCFPKTYNEIQQYGLPMSGKMENVEISKTNTAISIELIRSIVKLHLTVENATSDVLNLKWVKFGNFISDRVYLFRQTQLDVPESTLYKELRYPETGNFTDVVLNANEHTNWNSVYIYPNFAYKDPTGANPYTLSLGTNKKEYGASLLATNMNSMIRNTQFNITARITASATINISYEKVDWTGVTIDVPAFD